MRFRCLALELHFPFLQIAVHLHGVARQDFAGQNLACKRTAPQTGVGGLIRSSVSLLFHGCSQQTAKAHLVPLTL